MDDYWHRCNWKPGVPFLYLQQKTTTATIGTGENSPHPWFHSILPQLISVFYQFNSYAPIHASMPQCMSWPTDTASRCQLDCSISNYKQQQQLRAQVRIPPIPFLHYISLAIFYYTNWIVTPPFTPLWIYWPTDTVSRRWLDCLICNDNSSNNHECRWESTHCFFTSHSFGYFLLIQLLRSTAPMSRYQTTETVSRCQLDHPICKDKQE